MNFEPEIRLNLNDTRHAPCGRHEVFYLVLSIGAKDEHTTAFAPVDRT